jgi:hypothetical protein
MKAQIPRDAIVKTSRSPRQPRYEPLRINPLEPPQESAVPLRPA